MSQAYKIPNHLQLAFSQMGVKEFAGTPSNPQVEQYLEAVDLPSDDKIPWCAAFANYCVVEVGLKGTGSGLARSFLHLGEQVDDPRPGDIVVLRRGIDPRKGHVGFYLDQSKTLIYILGGNQNDRVGVNGYSKLRLLQYRRVS